MTIDILSLGGSRATSRWTEGSSEVARSFVQRTFDTR